METGGTKELMENNRSRMRRMVEKESKKRFNQRDHVNENRMRRMVDNETNYCIIYSRFYDNNSSAQTPNHVLAGTLVEMVTSLEKVDTRSYTAPKM